MEATPKANLQENVHRRSRYDKLVPPKNILQTILIEKYRLNFLQQCKYLKRPPQSLRLSGCSSLPNSQRLKLLSEFESKILEISIKNKLATIKELEENLNKETKTLTPMSKKVKNKWVKYFKRKIDFYKQQENTKWTEWESKSKHNNNSNRKIGKKKRKLKKQKEAIASKAKSILESKQVRILIEEDVPPEAVVVLGKGLGFVPTPKLDVEELRLDGRRLANSITALDITNNTNTNNTNIMNTCDNIDRYIPTKLKPINYSAPSTNIKNPLLSQTIDIINTKLNTLEKSSRNNYKKNLSSHEVLGLKWLEKKTSNMDIVITQADKGGSILIVPPLLIENKINEKLSNPQLFVQIQKDPRPQLYDELFNIWKEGKNFVTQNEAFEAVGLTKDGNKSTSSHYKPGTTFFTPSLKIHKMKDEDIIPGCNPPSRLISSLQDGVTKRSDIFIANKWLKPLENDFCTDMVKDTNSTLRWLDTIDKTYTREQKAELKPFTFDFEALYDSLTPDLVVLAIRFAINKCRPNWSNEFTDWVLKNVALSMKSANGIHKGNWYKPVNGIPTGGSLSVQLANITVFYVLYHTLYSNEILMSYILSLKRFIDDETGLFKGTVEQFKFWKEEVTRGLKTYNLNIKEEDWDMAVEPNSTVHFLDIKYGFNHGVLILLERKPLYFC